MKYCSFCGEEVADEAVMCVHCGRYIAPMPQPAQSSGSNINMMCLLGFIFSFVMCGIGLILSIIGYNQVKNTQDNTSKTFAKAGIIISSIICGIFLCIIIFYIIFIVLLIFSFA